VDFQAVSDQHSSAERQIARVTQTGDFRISSAIRSTQTQDRSSPERLSQLDVLPEPGRSKILELVECGYDEIRIAEEIIGRTYGVSPGVRNCPATRIL
jgi:hypothetical protein